MKRLLCFLGFHRWADITDPEWGVYGSSYRCRICGKKKHTNSTFR